MKDKAIQKRITQNVNRILKKLDWTGYRLAQETKVIPASVVYRLLDNKLNWSIEYLLVTAEILGVSLESLLQEEKKSGEKIFVKYKVLEEENMVLREKIAKYESTMKKLIESDGNSGKDKTGKSKTGKKDAKDPQKPSRK